MISRDIGFREAGANVRKLQEALINLGYELPKFGADGSMGHETMAAVEDFTEEYGHEGGLCEDKIAGYMVDLILEASAKLKQPYVHPEIQLFDVTNDHPRKALKGWRKWSDVTGITLHQTGIFMNDTPQRFHNLKAHVGILTLPKPTIVKVYPYNAYLWHANAFNKSDVGIEFNGCFAGIEGKITTAWRGGFRKGKDKPDSITDSQIIAGRESIRIIMNTVEGRKGQIKYIHAHRQTSATRRSDPGSKCWNEVGIWAKKEFGLSDGGPDYTERDGRPIPRDWDPSYTAPY